MIQDTKPVSRQHAHTFHLQRLLSESSSLPPRQRSAFLKQQIQIGEFTENAVRTMGARIPNVPAVFVERTFRAKLQEIIDKIETGHFSFGGNNNLCGTTTEEQGGTNTNYELSSDTKYQEAFDQFIEAESEMEG